MVEKIAGGTATQFVYSPSGTNIALVSAGVLIKGTVPLPGGDTAIYSGTSGNPSIRHTDWLGSSRLATTWAHTVQSREAYAPFGEVYNEAGTPDRSFTGQDQDLVSASGGTGVYDFLFRKYDPSAGRWLSPDPYNGSYDITNPQSMNRYAYVLNNPLAFVDPVGLVALNYCYYGGCGIDYGYTDVCDIYVCFDSGEGGSGAGGLGAGGGGGGNGAPNNGQPKSPARQKCEAQAQQQFDATRASLNQGFWSQMKSSAREGFVGGLIGGCLFTSEVGCFEGVVPGAVIGALSGASISTYHYIWNNGPQMTAARQQYEQQMQACMFQ